MSAAAGTHAGLRPVFVLTVLLGSFLLFLIQPMFARIVLPLLGGSPQVWTSAMLFFQTALLLGYLYAHLLRRFTLRTQVIVHLGVFAAAAATLPVATAGWWPPVGDSAAVPWLLGLLTISIGPVFVAVAAQAPLMQAWFARTDDAHADDPYFLYAASNAGSLAALAAYPLLVEPLSGVRDQSRWWSAGFVTLFAMVAVAGWSALRLAGPVAADTPRLTMPRARTLGRWVLLAFVPSGLLLSTTSHLTTDVMAMPLLWVIPLAVYLISFIVAFSAAGPWVTGKSVAFGPATLLILGGSAFMQIGWYGLVYALFGIALLLVVALALHGMLAAERPEAGQLTAFYLAMSVGGALGGLFCAIIAPAVFDWTYEHPILLLAAGALLPARPLTRRIGGLWCHPRAKWWMLTIVPALTAAIAAWTGGATTFEGVTQWKVAGVAMIALVAVLAIGQRGPFLWHFAMLMLALGGWREIRPSFADDQRFRSFFGVYTISRNAELTELLNGTTLHGVQSNVARYRRRPMSYYVPDSGVGRAFMAAPALFGPHARMAFVGLGAGTLACYALPGQTWTVYEIDPVAVRIARNPKLFSYLADCKRDIGVVVGDARHSLAAARPASHDMLAIDAFSSDAIPTHLLTREAFGVYDHALAPGGVLLIHVSNRFLDLAPLIAANARADGWTARELMYVVRGKDPYGQSTSHSDWIALTRTPGAMDRLLRATAGAGWRPLSAGRPMAPWTDDHASIVPVLKLLRNG